ncbi:MAG: hypothetical protein HGA63_10800, partial [Syntrophobacteraceae bacterium]|nr:hypothetical protein [Syntrophobacteraceae bacterium]
HMNDDLDIKGAVDGLLEDLDKLAILKKDGLLGPRAAARAEAELRRIDAVIQVLFPASTTYPAAGKPS